MKLKNYNFLVLLWLICLINPIYSQERSNFFENFTISNGLSNNSINDILQTSQGYLWIATKDGLNRYDGQNFRIFKTNSSQPESLPQNYIMCLLESRNGTLFVGTWGSGLCIYNPVQENFISLNLPGSGDDYVQCITEDINGSIWFGTLNGSVYKYLPDSNQLTSIRLKVNPHKIPEADNVTSIKFTDDNVMLIGTWGSGLFSFDAAADSLKHYLHNSAGKNSLSNNFIWSICNGPNKQTYVCTENGFDLFTIENNSFTNLPLISEKDKSILKTGIRIIYFDTVSRLWIGTWAYKGLYLLDLKEKENKLTSFINVDDDPNSLVSDRIRFIYEDQSNNLWFGTEDGLSKLPATKQFNQYRYIPARKNSIGGKFVTGFAEAEKDILWVGYSGGVDRINLNKNLITHYKPDYRNKNSLNDEDVTALFVDSKGIVWIGTEHEGLNRLDPRTGNFIHFKYDAGKKNGLNNNWIQQILETKNAEFLVGTNDGLMVLNRANNQFTRYNPATSNGSSLPEIFSVNSLYEDKLGNIWIGTWLDGLFVYNGSEKRFNHYMPENDNSFSISSNKISTIIEDSKGYIWLGTHSGGINKFDTKTEQFTRYTTLNGLPNDVVFGIQEDESGNIWISTMNGLAKFNTETEQFRIYDVSDGLIHNQFNWHASYKNRSGKMFFGGRDGFVWFYPDSIKTETNVPKVVLTSFKIFDQETALPQSLPTTKEILLQYYQNFFTIEYAALNLAPQNKQQFLYKLEGIDPDWVNSRNRTQAFYTDINPGIYTFNVKTSNADGVWSEPVSLIIEILPAWWMTWWFKVLLVLAFIQIGFIIYRIRVNRLMELQRVRLNIANDLHDEIGSNLSSISVDSQLLLSINGLNDKQKELAFYISSTVKETMDAMRDIIWFINPRNDFGNDTTLKMKDSAAKILAGMEWSFDVSAKIRFEILDLDVRRNVFLIYKEALTNVAKHSGAKYCEIKFAWSADNFVMSITDHGKGFSLQSISQNNGIKNMKRRAEKISSSFELKSEPGEGTSIRLIIPTNPKAQKKYHKQVMV